MFRTQCVLCIWPNVKTCIHTITNGYISTRNRKKTHTHISCNVFFETFPIFFSYSSLVLFASLFPLHHLMFFALVRQQKKIISFSFHFVYILFVFLFRAHPELMREGNSTVISLWCVLDKVSAIKESRRNKERICLILCTRKHPTYYVSLRSFRRLKLSFSVCFRHNLRLFLSSYLSCVPRPPHRVLLWFFAFSSWFASIFFFIFVALALLDSQTHTSCHIYTNSKRLIYFSATVCECVYVHIGLPSNFCRWNWATMQQYRI